MPDARFKVIKVRELMFAQKPAWYVEKVDAYGIDFTDFKPSKFAAISDAMRRWPEIQQALNEGGLS